MMDMKQIVLKLVTIKLRMLVSLDLYFSTEFTGIVDLQPYVDQPQYTITASLQRYHLL